MRRAKVAWVVIPLAVVVLGLIAWRVFLHKPEAAQPAPAGARRAALAQPPGGESGEVADEPASDSGAEAEEGASMEEILRRSGVQVVETESSAPETAEPDTWRDIAQQRAAESQAAAPEAEAAGTEASAPDAGTGGTLQGCPFVLRVGQEIDYAPGYEGQRFGIEFKEGRLARLDLAGWRLRGVGGELLDIEQRNVRDPSSDRLTIRLVWMDQPFEVLKDGQLVGSFSNTAEYQQAIQ